MTVQLDWQQDLEEQGWPKRQDQRPPDGGLPRWTRRLLLVVVLVAAAAAIFLWRRSNSGLSAARSDIQETLAFSQWALQQQDRDLFVRSLDPAAPQWQAQVMAQWDDMLASAQDVPLPEIEDIQLRGDIAETVVRWHDATTGGTYVARRWFRLVDRDWRWTRPRADGWRAERTQGRQHLKLTYHTRESEIVAPALDALDQFTATQCQRYQIAQIDCLFYLQWDLLDGDGQPVTRQDLALPPLASSTADQIDGSLYLANLTEAAWNGSTLRQRMRSFYPGDVYVAQSQLDVLRPDGATSLPVSLLGESSRPIPLATPWLTGIDDGGLPHPRWLDYAQRVLTDAIMRRAEGTLVGAPEYVNAAWALHQAMLSMDQGQPELSQLATPGPAAPMVATPLEVPDLSSLGAALQSQPSELALTQLADLVRFLSSHWNEQELLGLVRDLDREAFIGPLLSNTLGISEEDFLQHWRASQLDQEDSPLAALARSLERHVRAEAEVWATNSPLDALQTYTERGRRWRRGFAQDAPFGSITFGPGWQGTVTKVGAIEDVVWVELVEENGNRRAADLRFYRRVEDGRWLRDAPDPRFWGEALQGGDGPITWHYYELDRDVVEPLIPEVREDYLGLTRLLDLSPEPITIHVIADTLTEWFGQVEGGREWKVASPRVYSLDGSPNPARNALRRNVEFMVILSELSRRAEATGSPNGSDGRAWSVLVGTLRYLLEQRDIPTQELFGELDVPVVRAVEAGRLPAVDQVLGTDLYGTRSLEGSAQILLVTYLLDEHGESWSESLFDRGLQYTLDAVLADGGWTPDEFQADWHRYLNDKFGSPQL